ncbi:MAG TPA: tetratricopeptide repeat protein [bacterium]|nr:tetratricopeptide repeat protein [bacterium]
MRNARRLMVLGIAAVTVLIATPLRAADITEVPQDVSSAAVAAFRAGLALHREKHYAAAIKEYERAISLGGRFPEAFNNLAYCYRKTGQIDRALELYKTAIALRPTFPQAHDYIARAYLSKGDRTMAMRHYEIVKRLDGRLAHCLLEAIRRGDPDYNDMPWGS